MESSRQEKLIAVFTDTQAFYGEEPVLVRAVEESRKQTVFHPADDYPAIPDCQRSGRIVVSKSKTFQAATEQNRKHPGQRIAVLNFASPTNPGGGVKRGSSAQEESLCRCSTLFPTIDRRWLWDKYYTPNRDARDPIGTDALIYSPGVVICKTDENIPERMPPEEFVTVDVITCAAPNLRERPWNAYNPGSGLTGPLTGAAVCLFLFHVTRWINHGYLRLGPWIRLNLPAGLYTFGSGAFPGYVLTGLGFPMRDFFSTDYFSFLPWFFLFRAGFFLNRVLAAAGSGAEAGGGTENTQSGNRIYDSPLFHLKLPFLNLIGRHSLPVYLLHQPLLYLLTSFLF